MDEIAPALDAGQNLDQALIASAFALIADHGWHRFSVAKAAQHAGLPLAQVRTRFPCSLSVLMRFGALADQAALTGAITDGPVRDRVFDIVMRRIDALQAHRAGVVALLRDLPMHPLTALALAPASMASMAWMLEAVGLDATGVRGTLRTKGMLLMWLATLRAWTKDDSEDLSATMAELDKALNRAEQAETTMRDMFGDSRNETATEVP